MDYLKVEGHDGLVRDQNTGAILNLDDSAIEARRKSKHLGSALDDINMLKNEVSELKSLLRELIKNASS
jgi:hypothetical protein|tara:strand:+ start:4375 stop:4581 length:207 start_codon:yes stop_codon:yes gene_type:complete